jgi:methylmalonyl-CoA/ethylmalonyl-CoA epimerase
MKTSDNFGLTFHHLGLAVKQPEDALRLLTGLGYEISSTVRDPLQNVNLALCTRRGMPAIEIIYPTETSGPLAHILKSNASLIYHICYESENVEQSLRAMESGGNRVLPISPPKPAVLFGGRHVSFYLVSGFGMIEILETS